MKILIQTVRITLTLLIICGILYPLGLLGISQLLFYKQANGSIIEYDKKAVGSELLGQNFTNNAYFHGRVSACNYNTYTKADTLPDPNGQSPAYTGVSSGSDNLAPSSDKLTNRVKNDMKRFIKSNPTIKPNDIPTDLMTSSGSSIDPHISLNSAKIQIARISKATNIPSSELELIISDCSTPKCVEWLGISYVNVLKANLEIAKKLHVHI